MARTTEKRAQFFVLAVPHHAMYTQWRTAYQVYTRYIEYTVIN